MRDFKGPFAVLFVLWALVTAGFHVYTAFSGAFEPRTQRSIHMLLLLSLAFLVFPAKRGKSESKISVLDWILFLAAVMSSFYIYYFSYELNNRMYLVSDMTTAQLILGAIIVILSIEACRRAVSPVFAIVVTLVLSYAFIAPYLPGRFSGRGYSVHEVIEVLYLSPDDGVYGFLAGISSNVLFIFILFAAFLVHSGMANFFMDVAVRIAGKFRGGPSKVTVFSSGAYGSICGSSVSDVYATGSFSIPMMKKIGYPARKAGAIEAVASAGGPLMPPVMGAGAFVMAEMTNTSYLLVIKSALLAALLYYIGLFFTVHFEAVSLNLKSAPKSWYVPWKSIFKRLHLIIPFIVLTYFLLMGFSPPKSAVYSLGVIIILWLIDMIITKKKRDWKMIVEACVFATKSGVVIAAALAGAGILVGIINHTGLATMFSHMIVEYSMGNLWIALFLVAMVTIILGAGIPTTPAYVITVSVSAAALSLFEVPALATHLFVFYFAIMADITPPVGVTAFAAAGMAGAEPMRTALQTPRFAFAGFLVPFVFIVKPELLLLNEPGWVTVAFSFTTTIFALVLISSAVAGALFQKITIWERIVLALLGILVINVNIFIFTSAVIISAIFIFWKYIIYVKEKSLAAEVSLKSSK